MGLRSDHQTGTTYGLKGHTPVIPGTGKRFLCYMMSSIANQGKLAFMVFTHGFTAAVMIEFMSRLIRQSQTPVFLIVDGHPVHRSQKVNAWLARYTDQIQLFRLPAYSPEPNPDEPLNQDVKSNALGRRRPTTDFSAITDFVADTVFFSFTDMLRCPHWIGYSPFPSPPNRGEVNSQQSTVHATLQVEV